MNLGVCQNCLGFHYSYLLIFSIDCFHVPEEACITSKISYIFFFFLRRKLRSTWRGKDMCTPVADSCWYMAKPIQYCKVKIIIIIIKLKKKIKANFFNKWCFENWVSLWKKILDNYLIPHTKKYARWIIDLTTAIKMIRLIKEYTG